MGFSVLLNDEFDQGFAVYKHATGTEETEALRKIAKLCICRQIILNRVVTNLQNRQDFYIRTLIRYFSIVA